MLTIWDIGESGVNLIFIFSLYLICLVFKLQFLDMSSLQAALPDALLPAAFGGIAEPWLPQNTVTPYISSAGEGKLANFN
jgi:hypothetical protein